MKRLLSIPMILAVALAIPATAGAQQWMHYGWEDGVGTILGSFGNLCCAANVGAPNPVHNGSRSLTVSESPISGTPQAYVACVDGLNIGDVVTASFWGYDTTPGVSPSLRIWGHYATSCPANDYQGSASGNFTYSAGIGWEKIEHTWTIGTAGALFIEARLYSSSSGPDPQPYFIDDVKVLAPAGATITFPGPGEPTTAAESNTWGGIKTLFR